jgi:hypothetical protein
VVETWFDLAAQEVTVGRAEDALQALAESSRLDEQLGRLAGRSYRLAVAAAVHLVRGHIGLSAAALGGDDAHTYTTGGSREPRGRHAAYSGWFSQTVASTRGQLEPSEVDAATVAARSKAVDELIDELIIQPAMEAT